MSLRIGQLTRFFVDNSSDTGKLALLFEELAFRHRKAARLLREQAVARLRELATRGEYFAWPSTHVEVRGTSVSLQAEWREEGALRFLGYRVGMAGVGVNERRDILEDAFKGHLPPLQDASYMDELGRPNTARRLQKLANIIAALVRNAKRRDPRSMQRAIADWESDLDFLKRRFYDGHFDFSWPRTYVAP